MKKILIILSLLTIVYAWSGYNWDSSSYIEIEKGTNVKNGNTIEYYDYGDSTYKEAEVESMYNRGSSVEVEVYDYDTGEYKTFDMDRN